LALLSALALYRRDDQPSLRKTWNEMGVTVVKPSHPFLAGSKQSLPGQ